MSAEMLKLVLDETADKMRKAVEHTRSEFAGVRTGRATPALVEKLPVEYYGSEVPLQQIAGFQVPEARMLVISPYDKSALGAIEKAIQHSDLGLNPSNDGQVIRLAFPQLTAERRKDLVRVVKNMAEEGRIAIRNVRRDIMQDLRELKNEGEVGEDDEHRAEAALQKQTDEAVGEVDALLKGKEEEILEV